MPLEVQLINGVPTPVEVKAKAQNKPQAQSSSDALDFQHKEWLGHPMTIRLLNNLRKRKENSVDFMASNVSIIDDESFFRTQAAVINNIDILIKHILDTQSFINYLKKEQ